METPSGGPEEVAEGPDAGVTALIGGVQRLGVSLDGGQVALFGRYRDELLAWNRMTNLTAITDPTAVMTRHFLDSLTLLLGLSAEERSRPLRLIDVGSGAGLPGLALALAFPHWQVTLLESVGKKTAFLRHVQAALGLGERVTVLTGRAEDVGRAEAHRAGYAVATARAVASLATLAEYLLPFCQVGGKMIVLKKGDLAAEMTAAKTAVSAMGGTPLRVHAVPSLADLGAERLVLVSTKHRPTPAAYPRRAGVPAREPLGGTESKRGL